MEVGFGLRVKEAIRPYWISAMNQTEVGRQKSERGKRKALAVLIITLGVSAGLYSWLLIRLVDEYRLIAVLYVLPILPIGLFVSYRYWKWGQLEKPLTDEQKLELGNWEREEQARQRKSDEFWDRWYIRYGMACASVIGAAVLYSASPNKWFLSALLLLLAIILAREILLILLISGVAYFVFRGIASLPVSVALILGAFIIAGAISSGRRK